MGRLCAICTQQESKYKCPVCRAPYCSSGCYKTHKETPCTATPASTADAAEPPVATQVARSNHRQPHDNEEDDIDPTKLLAVEQLAGMRQSLLVKQHLANPHIREVLSEIDASSNRMKALEKALLDPFFSNFIFRTLDEIESK